MRLSLRQYFVAAALGLAVLCGSIALKFYLEMHDEVGWALYALMLLATIVWLLLAAFLVIAGWVFRRPRGTPGQCASCGYDLRGSPDRCPECGTVVTVAARTA